MKNNKKTRTNLLNERKAFGDTEESIWKMQYCQIWVIYTHNGITGNGFEIFLNSWFIVISTLFFSAYFSACDAYP